jgi:exodeoxyribonuclease VII small subunit
MAKKQEKLSFEEALAGLRKSAEAIKSESISLEDAIAQYEQGVAYYNQCKETLEEARQKIEIFETETGIARAFTDEEEGMI